MAAARVARPPLARLPYEERHPSDLWEECFHFRSRWDTESSLTSSPCQSQIRQSMSEFRRQKAINFVWLSNKLEGTLPEGASEHETNTVLRGLLDRLSCPVSDGVATGETRRPTDPARQQLEQHMMAYIKLCEKAIAEREHLSEKLILEIHAVLMEGLENDGRPVKAGVYRKIPVRAGDHCFPSHEVVPTRMPEIVAEYNQKVVLPGHDTYQLASWLLQEVISLHPFEDGNGRLCRLLWCYSLMRDGLPFPTTLSSGHKKAYRHYIQALKKCQRSSDNGHSHLTSLTVLSVHNGWSNFFNWDKYEKPSTF